MKSHTLVKRVAWTLFGAISVSALAATTVDIEALVRRVAERQAELQRERDRNGRMKSEFSGAVASSNGSCWAEQPVRKLEVLVTGSHLPNGNASRGDSAKKTVGNPALIKIVFSENFAVQVENEEQYQLFAQSGRYVSQDFSNKKIREMGFLKVEKGGVGYKAQKVTTPCFMGIGCWTGYDSSETNRYNLASITVKVNDQTVYQRGGINYTFEGDRRVWQDGGLGGNPEYVRLMARTDCPVNQ